MHDHGISYEGDVLDLAIAQKLVVRSGAWFRYGEVQLGQGREKTRVYMQENPQLVEELRNKIMSVGDPVRAAIAVDGNAAEGDAAEE
jgi:recombination protein RecA